MGLVQNLSYGEIETYLNSNAYDVAERVHKSGPPRKTGENYFCHPVRAATSAVKTQLHLGIRCYEVVIALLLHDGVEEAEKSEQDPRLVSVEIAFTFGKKMQYVVVYGTKNKSKETGHQFIVRLSHADLIEILWSKCEDRYDNLKTEDQWRKIVEYEECFHLIYDRLEFLVERKIEKEKMHRDLAIKWRRLVPYLKHRNERVKNRRKQVLQKLLDSKKETF